MDAVWLGMDDDARDLLERLEELWRMDCAHDRLFSLLELFWKASEQVTTDRAA